MPRGPKRRNQKKNNKTCYQRDKNQPELPPQRPPAPFVCPGLCGSTWSSLIPTVNEALRRLLPVAPEVKSRNYRISQKNCVPGAGKVVGLVVPTMVQTASRPGASKQGWAGVSKQSNREKKRGWKSPSSPALILTKRLRLDEPIELRSSAQGHSHGASVAGNDDCGGIIGPTGIDRN